MTDSTTTGLDDGQRLELQIFPGKLQRLNLRDRVTNIYFIDIFFLGGGGRNGKSATFGYQ